MMDFVVREGAAIVEGPMAVVRLGTCGGLAGTRPGDVVITSRGCVLVRLEPDFAVAADAAPDAAPDAASDPSALPMRPTAALPYSISRVVPSDAALSEAYAVAMEASLAATAGSGADLSSYAVQRAASATADGFYASQGRETAEFADRNAGLVDELERRVPGIAGLEMETFQLLCLAAMSRGRVRASAAAIPVRGAPRKEGRGGDWARVRRRPRRPADRCPPLGAERLCNRAGTCAASLARTLSFRSAVGRCPICVFSARSAHRGVLFPPSSCQPPQLVSRRGGEWLDSSHMQPLELAGGKAAFEALTSTDLPGAMPASAIQTSA